MTTGEEGSWQQPVSQPTRPGALQASLASCLTPALGHPNSRLVAQELQQEMQGKNQLAKHFCGQPAAPTEAAREKCQPAREPLPSACSSPDE